MLILSTTKVHYYKNSGPCYHSMHNTKSLASLAIYSTIFDTFHDTSGFAFNIDDPDS